jgi:hypothetical protein
MSILPHRDRLKVISNSLKAYYSLAPVQKEWDNNILAILGQKTEQKAWLSASLDKTIRMQMDPPQGMRAISALEGPDWIMS